jgi:hypothetical protein
MFEAVGVSIPSLGIAVKSRVVNSIGLVSDASLAPSTAPAKFGMLRLGSASTPSGIWVHSDPTDVEGVTMTRFLMLLSTSLVPNLSLRQQTEQQECTIP